MMTVAERKHLESICMKKVHHFNAWYRSGKYLVLPRDVAFEQWFAGMHSDLYALCAAEIQVIRHWMKKN